MNAGNDYSLSYERINELIASINSKADELDEKLEKIDTIANGVEEIWKGSDAEQYVTEIRTFKPQIKQLASTYKIAMSVLQSQTNIMHESQDAIATKVNSDLLV